MFVNAALGWNPDGTYYELEDGECEKLWKCPFCTIKDPMCTRPLDCTNCNNWYETEEDFDDCVKCGGFECIGCLVDIGGGIRKCKWCIDRENN